MFGRTPRKLGTTLNSVQVALITALGTAGGLVIGDTAAARVGAGIRTRSRIRTLSRIPARSLIPTRSRTLTIQDMASSRQSQPSLCSPVNPSSRVNLFSPVKRRQESPVV